MSKTNMFPL